MKRLAFIIALLPVGALLALTVGVADIANIWSYIFNPFQDAQNSAHQIIWQIRAPRIAAAILVGASLGIAGVLAQGSTNKDRKSVV